MDPLNQPVLDTLDYRLRPFDVKDAGLVREASIDPLIPLITTVPANGSDEEILDFINRQHHRLVDRSGYSFAIADARSDQALGQIGLWLKNSGQGRASVGYWIGPSHRNKGIVSPPWMPYQGGGLACPVYIGWNFTLSPGMKDLGELQSAAATVARGCCMVGRKSAGSEKTCICTPASIDVNAI